MLSQALQTTRGRLVVLPGLPAQPNVFTLSSPRAISAATALSLTDPEVAAELERRFSQ